jgi:hypothetical protein
VRLHGACHDIHHDVDIFVFRASALFRGAEPSDPPERPVRPDPPPMWERIDTWNLPSYLRRRLRPARVPMSSPAEAARTEYSLRLPADRSFLAFGQTAARHPSVRWEIQGIAGAEDGTATYDIIAYGPTGGKLLLDLRSELDRSHQLRSYQAVFESRTQAEGLFRTPSLLPPETVTLLGQLVVLPIRIHDGTLVIAFWSRQEEATAVRRSLQGGGWTGPLELREGESAEGSSAPLFPPEDLALLSVVVAMGYYRDPVVNPLSEIAAELGVDPRRFAERIKGIENGVLRCSAAVFGSSPGGGPTSGGGLLPMGEVERP